MKVINLKTLSGCEVPTHRRLYGYTIEHGWPIGTNGTTSKYVGWYRYKKDAVLKMKEYEQKS